MVKVCKINQLNQLKQPPSGCLADTNILFALYNPYEKYHQDAKKSFNFLSENNIPVYTNVNIKSEFIDLLRKLIISKYLMELYQSKKELNPDIEEKLGKLKDKLDKSKSKLKTFKLSDDEIKKWRDLLSKASSHKQRKDDWEIFCSDYLSGALSNLWNETEKQWNMNLLSYHKETDKALFIKEPEWQDMILLVEKFGVGSSDAMILNFFLCSRIPLLLTADKDLLYTIEKSNLFKNKIIAVPDTF